MIRRINSVNLINEVAWSFVNVAFIINKLLFGNISTSLQVYIIFQVDAMTRESVVLV